MIWVLILFITIVSSIGASKEGERRRKTCRSVLEALLQNPPPHTAVSYCCNFSRVTYECINGHKLVRGDKVRQCSDGRLTGIQPKCRFPRVRSCGNPGTIHRGFFIGSDFSVGDIVEYRCIRGYKLLGPPISVCRRHGTWTTRPTCVDENVMNVEEATAFISESLFSNAHQRPCNKSEACARVQSKMRRSLDIDFDGGLDVIFLLDGSNAVSKDDYNIGLKFAQELLRVLKGTITRGDLRVSVISYNNKPLTALNFAFPSEKVIKKIGAIKKPGGCGTSLGRAMYMVRRRVVPNTRADSNKAMFILSSGLLNLGTSHPKAARLLESESAFQIFSIAIGKNPNKRILTSVASQPMKSHVIFLRYYGDVFDAVRRTVTLERKDPTDCGVSVTKPRARNVRGNKVTSGVWPWHINIHWDGSPVCNGALIGQEWVITAAHCFYSKTWRPVVRPASRYTIKAGGHHLGDRRTSPEQVIEATKIYIHDGYNRHTHENDIALVKLQRKVNLGKYVRPVCMPGKEGNTAEDLALPGKHGYVAGWGEKQTQSSKSSKRRKGRSRVIVHVALAISPNAVCENSTRQTFNSTVMFCAGDEKVGQHSCRDDGGGPFVRERYDAKSKSYRWTVTGLVSWGEGCGVKDGFSYFTRVAPYFKWISSIKNPKKKGDTRRRRQRLNRRNDS